MPCTQNPWSRIALDGEGAVVEGAEARAGDDDPLDGQAAVADLADDVEQAERLAEVDGDAAGAFDDDGASALYRRVEDQVALATKAGRLCCSATSAAQSGARGSRQPDPFADIDRAG